MLAAGAPRHSRRSHRGAALGVNVIPSEVEGSRGVTLKL
jgi:hypothetical protein